MKVLLTGGAGYIGAVTAELLTTAGHEVVIFDHFDSHSIQKTTNFKTIVGDILHAEEIERAIIDVNPDVVMHFAAYIQMGESMRDPRKYYENNLHGSRNLVEAMIRSGKTKLVFASTAGVYGNPINIPIPEDDPKEPQNPYGETKLAFERLLKWYDKAYDFRSISIRFFNAAGATDSFGEDHHDESHIIPNIINAQLSDKEFILFGNDYPTSDGTCVRDYIHVQDLAQAFILSAEHLVAGGNTNAYNAGTGKGYSNKQIIEMVEKVASDYAQIDPEHAEGSLKIKVKYEARRPGDANELVADVTRIKAELSWSPKHSDLESIIRSAYQFHLAQNR